MLSNSRKPWTILRSLTEVEKMSTLCSVTWLFGLQCLSLQRSCRLHQSVQCLTHRSWIWRDVQLIQGRPLAAK